MRSVRAFITAFVFAGLCAAPLGAKPKVLLLVGGEVHDWKGVGDSVQKTLEASGLFEITRVENDLSYFTAEKLGAFNVVVFYWTLGALTPEQRSGLLDTVAAGKTHFVTFHSGADSFRGDPAYSAFVGGHFVGHPAYRQYEVSFTPVDHPITKGLGDRFFHTDEQYLLDYDARVTVLAQGMHKGALMPAIWVKTWGRGRVFYTGMGHDAKACEAEIFKKIITRATAWAAGVNVPA